MSEEAATRINQSAPFSQFHIAGCSILHISLCVFYSKPQAL